MKFQTVYHIMCVQVKKAFAVCPWEKGFQNYDTCRAPPFAQDFSFQCCHSFVRESHLQYQFPGEHAGDLMAAVSVLNLRRNTLLLHSPYVCMYSILTVNGNLHGLRWINSHPSLQDTHFI